MAAVKDAERVYPSKNIIITCIQSNTNHNPTASNQKCLLITQRRNLVPTCYNLLNEGRVSTCPVSVESIPHSMQFSSCSHQESCNILLAKELSGHIIISFVSGASCCHYVLFTIRSVCSPRIIFFIHCIETLQMV